MDKSIKDIIDEATAQWMKIPGVTGIGLSEKDGANIIVVMVETLTGKLATKFPDVFQGMQVEILETGIIMAENEPQTKNS